MSEIQVVVADSQFLIAQGIQCVLSPSDRFGLAGIAATKTELSKLLTAAAPQLLVVDPNTIDFDSTFSALQNIRTLHPQTALVILTAQVTKADISEYTKLGICTILNKNADAEELFSAFEAALKGKKFYSDDVLDVLMETPTSKYALEEPKNLTASEIEIVKLIADGKTTKEIAAHKCISIHTVNTHRKNIFRKLGVTNVSELIIQAIKAGWINNIEYFI